jgi:hypothetical protein
MGIIVENPDRVDQVEMIVGIPSYKEADSISYPTDVASRGLLRYFSDKKSVIINVDNNSPDGFNTLVSLFLQVLIKKTRQSPKDKFYYPSDLWARILFDFAIAYRNNEIPREQIIEAMIPFYHSRILSFVNKTGHMNIKECEEYFEDINRIFEKEKYYLIKRWDEDQKKLGHKLFG